MNGSYAGNYSIISSGYGVQAQCGSLPVAGRQEQGRMVKAGKLLLSLPAGIWRLICFKVLVIMVLALFSGFCAGVVYTIDSLDEVDDAEAIELLVLNEAEI